MSLAGANEVEKQVFFTPKVFSLKGVTSHSDALSMKCHPVTPLITSVKNVVIK